MARQLLCYSGINPNNDNCTHYFFSAISRYISELSNHLEATINLNNYRINANIAKISVGNTGSISFDLARIEKTLTNQNAVIPQVRVIFIKDSGEVVVLNDWKDISSYKTTTIQVSLASVANTTGTLVLEMDCSQNGDRAGVNVSNIVIG